MRKKITPNPNFFYTSTKYKFHVFNRLSDTEEKKLHVRKIQKYNEYCTFNCTVKFESHFFIVHYCAFVKYSIWICFEWIGCDVEVTLKENDIVPSHKRNILHLRSYIFHLIYCPARVSQQMGARDQGRMLKDKRSNNGDRIYFSRFS